MSGSPTRELRQRRSLPSRLEGTMSRTRLSEVSPRKTEVGLRRRDLNKEQLPSNVQFMFNSFSNKGLSVDGLSDAAVDLHGDKFRTFGENVDHVYGVLKGNKRSPQLVDQNKRKSPKQFTREKDKSPVDLSYMKVFGENPLEMLHHNGVLKTVHVGSASKELPFHKKRNLLGLQLESQSKSMAALSSRCGRKDSVSERESAPSTGSPVRNKTSIRTVTDFGDRKKGKSTELNNVVNDEDFSDTDDEVICNKKKMSQLCNSHITSSYNMAEYSDSSSCHSSARSSPTRKRKRHSSDTSDIDYVPKRSRPSRKNVEILPSPSPLRTRKLLMQVNEKLQQKQREMKSTEMLIKQEDAGDLHAADKIKREKLNTANKEVQHVKNKLTKKKDGRGRPRLTEQSFLLEKPKGKKPRKPGSGRPRKYPLEAGKPRTVGRLNKIKTVVNPALSSIASKCSTKKIFQSFSPNEEVLARWTDGILYLGYVVKIDEQEEKCYVKFEDNSKYWIQYKDLQKGASEDDDACCICQNDQSDPPNEIVLCDSCGLEPGDETTVVTENDTAIVNDSVRDMSSEGGNTSDVRQRIMGKRGRAMSTSMARGLQSRQRTVPIKSDVFNYFPFVNEDQKVKKTDSKGYHKVYENVSKRWGEMQTKEKRCSQRQSKEKRRRQRQPKEKRRSQRQPKEERRSQRQPKEKKDDLYVYGDTVEGLMSSDDTDLEVFANVMCGKDDSISQYKIVENINIKWEGTDITEKVIVKKEVADMEVVNEENYALCESKESIYTEDLMKGHYLNRTGGEGREEKRYECVEEKTAISTSVSRDEHSKCHCDREKRSKVGSCECNMNKVASILPQPVNKLPKNNCAIVGKEEGVTEESSPKPKDAALDYVDQPAIKQSKQIGKRRARRRKAARFECTQCDAVFDEGYKLKRHCLVHTELRPYKCFHADCQCTFKRKEHVVRHLQKVHKVKVRYSLFPEIEVEKKKTMNGILEVMKKECMMSITDESAKMPVPGVFFCVACNKSFRKITDYKMHNYTSHLQERHCRDLFICILCCMGFKTEKNLRKHLRNISCEPFPEDRNIAQKHVSERAVDSDSDLSESHSLNDQDIQHYMDGRTGCQTSLKNSGKQCSEFFVCPYHQECHNPSIEEDVLQPEVEWKCRLCVFAAAVKEGGALKTGPNAEALQKMKQTLPYDIETLTWDAQHRVNAEKSYCYCGGPGVWSMKMLQCCRCRQWFHEACIQCLDHPLLNGDKFYVFVCSHCNCGPEFIKRLEMTWTDLVHLALHNLSLKAITNNKYFEVDKIVDFINSHWEMLQLKHFADVAEIERRQKILNELNSPSNNRRFSNGSEVRKSRSTWSIRQRLPPAAPTVILPMEGKVTEDMMQNLQLVGKGRVKYLLPLDCSTIPPGLIKREPEDSPIESVPLTGYHNTLISQQTQTSKVQPTSNLSLDKLIPFPSNFTGFNHPFKTEAEQREEKLYELRKMQIMNYLCLNTDSDCVSQNSTTSCSTDDPTKLIPTPPPSLSGYQESCKAVMSDVKGRKRKMTDEEDLSSLRQSKRKRVSITGRYGIDPDVSESQSLESFEDEIDGLKIGVNNYLGMSDRLRKGERYHVLGKRISPDGKVHYLIQWEGLVVKDK